MFNRKKYLLNYEQDSLQRLDVFFNENRIELERIYSYKLYIDGEILQHQSINTFFCNKDEKLNKLFKFYKKESYYEE